MQQDLLVYYSLPHQLLQKNVNDEINNQNMIILSYIFYAKKINVKCFMLRRFTLRNISCSLFLL